MKMYSIFFYGRVKLKIYDTHLAVNILMQSLGENARLCAINMPKLDAAAYQLWNSTSSRTITGVSQC